MSAAEYIRDPDDVPFDEDEGAEDELSPEETTLLTPEEQQAADELQAELDRRFPWLAPAFERGRVTTEDFDDIFKHLESPVINLIYRLLGNIEQAKDGSQDTFKKAYFAIARGDFVKPDKLASWLYAIAANNARDALRRRRLISWLQLSVFEDDRGIGAGMPSTGARTYSDNASEASPGNGRFLSQMTYGGERFEDHIAERDAVQRALRGLKPLYRIPLVLHAGEGLTIAEVAAELDMSEAAIKMRLVRARAEFRALYEKERKDSAQERTTPQSSEQAPRSEVRQRSLRPPGIQPIWDAYSASRTNASPSTEASPVKPPPPPTAALTKRSQPAPIPTENKAEQYVREMIALMAAQANE